jgi:hypothetical protein
MLGNATTDQRDQDQVVYRWAKERNQKAKDAKKYHSCIRDPKIIVMDQLWLWIIDGGLYFRPMNSFLTDDDIDTVVSCFPQPLKDNSGGDALEDILKSIDAEARVPTKSAIQLASLIVSHCAGLLDRSIFDYDQSLRFQEYFEDSIAKEVCYPLKC